MSVVLCGCADKPTQPDKTPVALRIEAPARSIFSGGSLQLMATASFTDGTSGEVTNEVTWSNLPGRAGTVTKSGLFIASTDSLGLETIRADYQGQTASVQIEVTKRATTLAIWPAHMNVQAGTSVQFTAIAEFQDLSRSDVTQNVAWSVSPGVAATIDANGLLRAMPGATGKETVTGSYQLLVTRSKVEVQADLAMPFEMVTIPAGSFVMGDNHGRSNERPEHEVFVDAFQIGKYEVTNAQYATFLNEALAAGEIFYESFIVRARKGPFVALIYTKLCKSFEFPDEFIEFTETEPGSKVFRFRAKPGFEQYPVVRLNWFGAAAFCAFYGLRLPTEAEWEKACRGGQQLTYGTPDGSLSPDVANYAGTGGRDVFEGLAPVGSFPPNPYGLYDMSGNAAEFVFDLYDAGYYANSPPQNPQGPPPTTIFERRAGSTVLWRGGSWIDAENSCRSAFRGPIGDQVDHCFLVFSVVGFRVTRSLP
ncbi:MAG: SUMF1/EgtB/PvdO family nonheme iron enzyme [candidate division KSB1 bacterium]|nr:SUMF1/EgtB/PvdO family nonheme iron enzyme [candidate division KSB1 bacterium]